MEDIKRKCTLVMQEWMKIFLQLIILFLIVRIIFFTEVLFRFNNVEWERLQAILIGYIYDLILSCFIGVIILLPLSVILITKPKIGNILQWILLFLFLLISFILSEYFYNVGTPLDHVIFAYTPRNIIETIIWSTSISLESLFFLILYFSVSIIFFVLAKKLTPTLLLSSTTFIIAVIICCCVKYKKIIRDEWLFKTSHVEFLYAVNQPSYSIIKILDFKEKNNDSYLQMQNVAKATELYQTKNETNNYIDAQYPFMREFNDNDVLSAFLSKPHNGKLPNFVFLIVESLGQYLTTVDPQILSFTPFLDSLKRESLYWPNCISTTERTFGVMPAVFASVPQGRKGFANEWLPIPEYNSLLKEFHNNGYYISFFYGGAASFGGQNAFMKANDVDYISDVTLDTMTESRMSLQKEFHRWGVDDAELFDFAKRVKGQQDTKTFVDIYLTLSSHEPFEIPNIDTYKNKILKNWNIDETTKEGEIVKNNLNIYACFLYTDESLRLLFDYYKTRDDYENTIFIVTGDHRTGTGQLGNPKIPIQKYNVPLIIYSPLLNRIQTMEGVVSHYDITPSISSYLKHNYNYNTAEECHWLGSSFDTTKTFHCKKKQAFMLNNTDVVEFLYDTLYISHERLYSVQRGLRLKQIEDSTLLNNIQLFLNMYQTLSEYTLYNNKLLKRTTFQK